MSRRPYSNPYRDVGGTILIAQVFGVTPLLILAGQTAHYSIVTIPLLLASPRSLLLHQFHLLQQRHLKHDTPLLLVLSGVVAWLSQRFWSLSLTSNVWSTAYTARHAAKYLSLAAILPPAALLFTVSGLGNISKELVTRAQQQQPQRTMQEMEEGLEDGYELLHGENQAGERMSSKDAIRIAFGGNEHRETLSAHQLVDVWGILNLMRAGILFTAWTAAFSGMFCVGIPAQRP